MEYVKCFFLFSLFLPDGIKNSTPLMTRQAQQNATNKFIEGKIKLVSCSFVTNE
jgi:hypothetical protein